MTNLAKLTGPDFKCPRKDKILGLLLTITYDNNYQENKAILLKHVLFFGLTVLGDDAIVGRTPLTHVLGQSADTPPRMLPVT